MKGSGGRRSSSSSATPDLPATLTLWLLWMESKQKDFSLLEMSNQHVVALMSAEGPVLTFHQSHHEMIMSYCVLPFIQDPGKKQNNGL